MLMWASLYCFLHLGLWLARECPRKHGDGKGALGFRGPFAVLLKRAVGVGCSWGQMPELASSLTEL